MNSVYSAKRLLKLVRHRLRRAAVLLRWGPGSLAGMPIVLGNAMPKSGSHLIHQVVQGLTDIGPFVNPGLPPVNRDEVNAKLDHAAVLANLRLMRPGDIGYGYIKAIAPFIDLLTQPEWAALFVYRDPRDMIVSHVFYASEMHPGHAMHTYYTQTLTTMDDRIRAAIEGVDVPGSQLSPVRVKYEGYMGWLEQPAVLCLRFEDLIQNRPETLGRILDYLAERGFKPRLARKDEIARLERAVAPRRSGTFRKAKPGNWREHFSPENKAFFKQQAGDLLLRLGYERDNDW